MQEKREKRNYPRSNGLVLVSYRGLQIEGKSTAFDVSGSGTRLIADKKIKIGSQLELEIYLPGDSQPILAKGEVVRVEKCKEKANTPPEAKKEYFYIGIKFTVINENNKNRIIDYVYRKTH